jgi:hypothetical protein
MVLIQFQIEPKEKLSEIEALSVVLKNVSIFWDIAQCNLYVYRRFGGTYLLHIQI